MRPFYETENKLTGRTQVVHWDADAANRKNAEMRKESIDFLNKRDIERARAAGMELPDDAIYLPTCFDNGKGEMAMDPLATRIKHSGAELNDHFIPRWQAFCSVPQHPDDSVTRPQPNYKPKQKFESGAGYYPAQAVPASPISSSDVKPTKRKYTRKQEVQAN